METLQLRDELSGKMEDTNVQNEAKEFRSCENGTYESINILDFSDDVMLYILKYLSPRDLKALGFTCLRFARLVLERSLWKKVDARGQASCTARFRWLLTHALHEDTTTLKITGHAKENVGCCGHTKVQPGDGRINLDRDVIMPTIRAICARNRWQCQQNCLHIPDRHPGETYIPRFVIAPSWPNEPSNEALELVAQDSILNDNQKVVKCTGPRFTFTGAMYVTLIQKCCKLTTLHLEYCNINCRTTRLDKLPPTLTVLSLRGTKCYNLRTDRNFMTQLQEFLINLETLDLSECCWLDPSSFMPLSKLRQLTRLYLRDCPRLSEFIAYSSLACRYGFKALQELDLRGCAVSDSEVSSLTWLPELRVLRLEAQRVMPNMTMHKHFEVVRAPAVLALDDWEREEPEFFKNKFQTERGCGFDEDMDLINPYTAGDGERNDVATEKCDTILPKRQDKDTPKRKQDGSGGSTDFDPDAPSCSKYRKTDETEDGDKKKHGRRNDSDSDSDDTGTDVIRVVRCGNRMETEGSGVKICKKCKSFGPSEANETPPRNQLKDGPSSSSENTAQIRGIICLRRNRNPNENEPLQCQKIHKSVYFNISSYDGFVPIQDESNEGPPQAGPLHVASLVTDASVIQFGRSDGEEVAYINFGPNGPVRFRGLYSARPERSFLRSLSMIGFVNVTDRSLLHLATAAPDLEYLDLRGTAVTREAVEKFLLLKPDCKVLFGKLEE